MIFSFLILRPEIYTLTWIENPRVGGSNPPPGTILLKGSDLKVRSFFVFGWMLCGFPLYFYKDLICMGLGEERVVGSFVTGSALGSA